MCLGIPGQIVEMLDVHPHLARANVAGVTRNVNVGLVEKEGVKPGDWVLIHVGFAMSIIDEAEAQSTIDFLEGLGDAYTDELQAVMESRIE